MSTQRFCLALDLKNDPVLIEKYKEYHAPGNAWPEITESITSAGIDDMHIFCTGNRLFMIMEVNESFDPENKAKLDANNPKVQEWEGLMNQFQLPLPWAAEGEKWVLMDKIFQLGE
ncbi:MAG: L-rhamnose mutarotase [Reichenbachiella sp.]